MSPEGDGTGAGGAGGGSSDDPLFGGGGGNPPPSVPPAGNPPEGTPPPPAGNPPPPGTPPDWRASLPEDLRNQEFVKKYETPEALAKAYGNLEKMIGRDKVVVPQKGAKFEDPMMRDYFERVGLPKTADEYKIEGFDPKEVDPEFLKALSGEAHKLGVLPEQAKGLVAWFSGVNKAAYESQMKLQNDAMKADLEAFKAEAGDAYSTEIARAQAAVKELSKQDQEFLQKSGLSKNTTIIRMLAKYGATLSEDKIRGEGGRTDGVLTPAQAQEKIKEIQGAGPKHPYWDKEHADHAKAKKDMNQLFEYAFPSKTEDR